QPRPRATAELLRRAHPVPSRAAVVCGPAAGLAGVGRGTRRGRPRERAGRGSDAWARVAAHAGGCDGRWWFWAFRRVRWFWGFAASAASAAPEGVARFPAALTLVKKADLGGGSFG